MTTERHASDGELVALLDGELGPTTDLATHVDTCATCSARLAVVSHRAARLSELLAATTPPAVDADRVRPRPGQLSAARHRTRRRRLWLHPGLRAAAGILLVAGVAAASPARSWLVQRVTAWRAEPQPTRRDTPGRPTAPTPAPGQGPVIWFAAAAEELVIRFNTRPSGGSLTLITGDDPRSAAQVVSGSAGEALLVLPTELRVRNAATSVAEYEVTLSPLVRRVHVRVGHGTREVAIARVDATPGMRRVIPLAATEGSR